MINPNDLPTDQRIHHFKPTDQPIPTQWSKLSSPIHANPTSNLKNPKPSTGAMRERQAVRWEMRKWPCEMGEKFWQWSFGEERADGEREGRVRREQKKWEGWERNFNWNRRSIILFFLCNSVNSTILCLELYCSSIAKKFAILLFTISWCNSFLGVKY